MCGYIQRTAKIPKLDRIFQGWGISDPLPFGRFWPGTPISGVIIGSDAGAQAVDAMWWFLLEEKGGALKPNRQITCFNARNLEGRLWKSPFKTSRCVIPATAIVETKANQSYLMEASDGLLLGGLFRKWDNGADPMYSCSVITCDPHPRFSQYHDKSIPLLLPPDPGLLDTWLDPGFTDVGFFAGLIGQMRIPTDFEVTPVKNSQTLAAQGPSQLLEKD